jgi:hypothetical protein
MWRKPQIYLSIEEKMTESRLASMFYAPSMPNRLLWMWFAPECELTARLGAGSDVGGQNPIPLDRGVAVPESNVFRSVNINHSDDHILGIPSFTYTTVAPFFKKGRA